MGCGASKSVIQDSRPVQVSDMQERGRFIVKIDVPEKGQTEFKYDTDYEEMPLGTLMNFFLFDQNQSSNFNANFISKYSSDLKRYQYFIEKLAGVTMENEDNPYKGDQWVVYLNDIKHEWDSVCDKETLVKPQDNIRFRFELVSK